VPEVNWIAVGLCAVSSLVLGGIWYSPPLFARAWQTAAGLCWVAASYGISYGFERRPLKLWLINGGYHTLQFTLFGLILGLMQ